MAEPGVRVLGRACDVLDCFTEAEPRLGVADIRDRTGLPATTVARIVTTLVQEGLLVREGDSYRVGLRVLVWSAPARSGSSLLGVARPFVDQLRDVTGESAGLYVRQGASRVLVVAASSNHSVIYRGYVGQVLPLHAGAAGKCFMAFDDDALGAAVDAGLERYTDATVVSQDELDRQLARVRDRGWAYTESEREVGLNSVAAPVLGFGGRPEAALAIGGPSIRLDREEAERVGPIVAATAQAIAARMGHVPAEEPADV
ncbi:IclR family transcriptional regulator [Prauserella sp. PE36]|uniref:IclR family transcriptional regulator n=1 Tax=Prauserella sp. PE36 TaxID=1504709 RepID=UPI000D960133|nr:IclR family transcriptional regulator [Prauserella sp. PE36]PXY23219.1 IclR family transcriptional regulator [Prauserella coralliicola]RBM18812.1 IclR family transcriptional regulator [Prauserella sp. PE36]